MHEDVKASNRSKVRNARALSFFTKFGKFINIISRFLNIARYAGCHGGLRAHFLGFDLTFCYLHFLGYFFTMHGIIILYLTYLHIWKYYICHTTINGNIIFDILPYMEILYLTYYHIWKYYI